MTRFVQGRRRAGFLCLRFRAALLSALLAAGLFLPAGAEGARVGRLVKIGALTISWGPTPHVVGLRDGLTELGYREGEDFAIGVRFTQGKLEALYPAARELVEGEADIIFTVNSNAAVAAQRATERIPIVFTSARDPVGIGLVKSFARPGGNLTGLTDLDMELGPKRLELFKKLIPGLKKVLFPYNAYSRAAQSRAETYRMAARRLGIELVERPVRSEEEANDAFSTLRKQRVDGILSSGGPDLNILGLMLKATTRQKIPTMFGAAFMVEDGGFASYGPSWYEAGRQAARMVDKIVKGRKPADIPVEVNTRLVFAVNLKVARALGLKIPPQVLYQADRIVR